MELSIKVVNNNNWQLPYYATQYSAGVDLIAGSLKELYSPNNELVNLKEIHSLEKEYFYLRQYERALIGTGISVAVPEGYELQIRPRSGLALKKGITVYNTPGTIDPDYRGEVGVILINLSKSLFRLEFGIRIAQAVLVKTERIVWEEVTKLPDSLRGEGGFGHTGT